MFLALSKHLKNGLIVFFQSYTFLEIFKNILMLPKYIYQIQTTHKLFFDSQKDGANIFEKYQCCIKQNQNGVLFSVMGGKLSEGINFSDDLARCVIVFGLPYPNIKNIEIQERMRYFDERAKYQKHTTGNADFTGQRYYENQCMKVLNQTIGRAIRHKLDYALVILIDTRFKSNSIVNKLSKWVQNSVNYQDSIKSAITHINQFFYQNQP